MPVGNSSIKRAATAIANPDSQVVESLVAEKTTTQLEDDKCKNCKVAAKSQCDAPKAPKATKPRAVKEKVEKEAVETQPASTSKASRSNSNVANKTYGIGSQLPEYLL